MSEEAKKIKNKIISSWVKEFTKELLDYTIYKVSDYIAAENIVQDTFEAVVQGFEKFEQKSSPKTWIYGILKNKIRDYYKSNQKATFVSLATESNDDDSFFDEYGNWKESERPNFWKTSEDNNLLDDYDFRQVLLICIDHLPDKWQESIKLKYLEEIKGNKICEKLDINQANFWQILHRAKLQLRKCLENNWFSLHEE